MKDFRKHFFMLYDKLKSRENFAFSRFSDGELRIMQNKELILGDNFNKIGARRRKSRYVPEDCKHFNPETDQHVRKKLMDAYTHKAYNYYVGLSCRCCVGARDFKQMVNWRGGEDEHLTWANLLLNGNYPLFVEYMIPEFSGRKIVFVLNENADLDGLPFKVEQDFRVGKNCIVNDFYKIDKIIVWMEWTKESNLIFLFSASSLSNLMIYDLYKLYPNNTYIDIGTALNPYLKMSSTRGYLTGKNRKMCVW